MEPRRILIVDDEVEFLDSLADVFRDEGYEVETAANGSEALASLSQSRPGAVILDLSMPVMGGEEVYAAMRANPQLADIPVIISTSDPTQAPTGVVVVKKPIQMKRMLEAVHKL